MAKPDGQSRAAINFKLEKTMRTRTIRRKGQVSLVIDREDPSAPREVLASLQQMADSSNWFVIDIRLLQRPVAHEFSGSAAAEDFCAHLTPESAEERDFYVKKLDDYLEQQDGTLLWCTYRNMWRGEQGIDGYIPPSIVLPHVYMTFKNGLKLMKDIQDYWESFEGKIADAKVENPYRQPREGELTREWWMEKNLRKGQGLEP
ncbi:hypothetical protein ACOK4R_34650 (plasmid) [Pseudomonas fluorescens]|uniref:hypothetical protein n=1 Tax=Pseudomonas fluorescens TaxID=294 RepID=UPI003144F632